MHVGFFLHTSGHGRAIFDGLALRALEGSKWGEEKSSSASASEVGASSLLSAILSTTCSWVGPPIST